MNRCLELEPETERVLELIDEPERMVLASVKFTLRDLARRWKALDVEVKELSHQIKELVDHVAPELVELFGVSTELAGQFLVTAGDNPERIRNEAAFAKLCGVSPKPASSGRTNGRHRLNRGGDRAANSALYIVTIARLRHHEATRTTSHAEQLRGSPSARSSGVSSATSLGRYSPPCPDARPPRCSNGPLDKDRSIERSHRIDNEEFYRMLEGVVIDDTGLFNEKLQEWEDFYNFHRPHGALGGQTPYERLRQRSGITA